MCMLPSQIGISQGPRKYTVVRDRSCPSFRFTAHAHTDRVQHHHCISLAGLLRRLYLDRFPCFASWSPKPTRVETGHLENVEHLCLVGSFYKPRPPVSSVPQLSDSLRRSGPHRGSRIRLRVIRTLNQNVMDSSALTAAFIFSTW